MSAARILVAAAAVLVGGAIAGVALSPPAKQATVQPLGKRWW